MTTESNIIDFNARKDYNELVETLKRKLNAKHILIATVNEDGVTYGTFIEHEIFDNDLVYMIQCLKDRRVSRMSE